MKKTIKNCQKKVEIMNVIDYNETIKLRLRLKF